MTLDQICNGKLEQQIREGLAKLEPFAAKYGKPRIGIGAYSGSESYVGISIEGNDELSAFGFDDIPAAVDAVIKKINDPETANKRRKAIEQKIANLEAELRELPAPVVVRDGVEYTPGPSPVDHVLYPTGKQAEPVTMES